MTLHVERANDDVDVVSENMRRQNALTFAHLNLSEWLGINHLAAPTLD